MLEYNLMGNLLSLIITLAIIAGQLIKFTPIAWLSSGGLSLLDITIYLLCLYGLIRSGLHFKKAQIYIKSAIIFIIICALSLILSPIKISPGGFLVSLYYLVRFSAFILFAYLLYSEAFKEFTKSISRILKDSGVALAILGLLQFIFIPDLTFMARWGWDPHYFRTVSTFLDPNFVGAFFVLTLILLTNEKTTKMRMFFLIAVYIALLTTFSRSSFLMFFVSGLTLSLFEKSKKVAIITILFFLILLLGFQIYTQVISKPRNIDREKSASFRLNTWQQGWQVFISHPILGVGFNAYRYAISQYNLGDRQFLESRGSSSNDSSLLFVMATTGIVGLISYLFFLFTLIKKAWRKNTSLVSGLAGLLIHSFFANSLFFPPILLWILLISKTPKE